MSERRQNQLANILKVLLVAFVPIHGSKIEDGTKRNNRSNDRDTEKSGLMCNMIISIKNHNIH